VIRILKATRRDLLLWKESRKRKRESRQMEKRNWAIWAKGKVHR
jgi:hypothetical protein